MQTLEERKTADKERHRRRMAIKRAAFKANLDSSREEFDTLSTEQLSLLTAYWDRQDKPQHTSSPTHVDNVLDCESTTLQVLCNSYVGAVELGNVIHIENTKIKKKLDEYEQFVSVLDRDITQLKNVYKISDNRKHSTKHDELFYYEAVDSFFGWNVRRLVNNGHHLHFSKRVSCVNGAQLTNFIGDEAWRVFNTPELYERLYTSRVMMHVLQRVDTNTSVAPQSLPAVDNATSRRCLTLASKIVTIDEEGYQIVTILLLAITPNEDMAKRNAPCIHFVYDMNAYLLLHQRVDEFGQEFVEMSFGLHGVYTNETEARFVFLESACALVRFEQMVLPQNLVTSE